MATPTNLVSFFFPERERVVSFFCFLPHFTAVLSFFLSLSSSAGTDQTARPRRKRKRTSGREKEKKTIENHSQTHPAKYNILTNYHLITLQIVLTRLNPCRFQVVFLNSAVNIYVLKIAEMLAKLA